MTTLLLILIILVSVLVGLFILIQNPKGGGIGSMGGFSSSFSNKFGVQQTGNILEKGTYTTIALLAILAIISVKVSKPEAQKVININQAIQQNPATAPIENITPEADNPQQSDDNKQSIPAPTLQLPKK